MRLIRLKGETPRRHHTPASQAPRDGRLVHPHRAFPVDGELNMAAIENALKTPELAAMVFDWLTPAECYSALFVNKFLSACAARRVWRDLSGMEVLLQLLMEEPLQPLTEENAQPKVALAHVIKPTQARLGRFDLYRSYVQTLSVFPKVTLGYRWRAFTALSGYAPILPQLRSLIVQRDGDSVTSATMRDLLSLFATPTCLEVCVSGGSELDVPWLLNSDAVPAISCLRRMCERIRRLDLFIKTVEPSAAAEVANAIQHFTQLRELGLGIDVLSESVLAAAGGLPYLGVLTLRGHKNSRAKRSAMDVPQGSFPSLKRLVAWGVWPADLLRILNVRPLPFRIESASFEVLSPHGGARTLAEDRDIFRSLSRGAPCLRDLGFAFPRSSGTCLTSLESLSPLFDLRLERLRLHHVCLQARERLGELFKLCPRWHDSLVHFGMRRQAVGLDDLKELARFNSLQTLSVALCIGSVPAHHGAWIEPKSKQRLRLESDFALHSVPDLEDIDRFAVFLLTCWLDVEPVVTERTFNRKRLTDVTDSMNYTMLLNMLAVLRERPPNMNTLRWV
ncbi:hypothetical protein FRC08_002291 [Ceratobasidium sp. 394]|nr:hypothetical protein FRC08_002291 [Ceratobasidium sp. 394]KAG9097153.1 hypothetical protein FS749_006951 [Ceratobasidium sp. UAMH 11750]